MEAGTQIFWMRANQPACRSLPLIWP